MRKSTLIPLVVAAAGLTVSCQKIQEPPKIEANLKVTAAPFTDAIPREYGQFVGVTTSPEPFVHVMYFRKPDDSLVLVRVNYARGGLGPVVTEIPRK